MKQIIYTTQTFKDKGISFGRLDKRIKWVLKDNSMIVILNRVSQALTKSINKKGITVQAILHEWDDTPKSFYTYFHDNIMNSTVEDKEIYLGQLLYIAKKMYIWHQMTKQKKRS